MVVERLGPRPADPAAARLWDTASARIDQHRNAFTPIDESLLGRTSHGNSAFRDSQARAEHAIQRLDHTVRPELHRHLERSLDLGISM